MIILHNLYFCFHFWFSFNIWQQGGSILGACLVTISTGPSCDRSASALRRLYTYLRCTQSQEQFSALALLQLNFVIPINEGYVCKPFFHEKSLFSVNQILFLYYCKSVFEPYDIGFIRSHKLHPNFWCGKGYPNCSCHPLS